MVWPQVSPLLQRRFNGLAGMTSQVSDVQANSPKMRPLTMVHGGLSFGFNMLILALGINMVAGLL